MKILYLITGLGVGGAEKMLLKVLPRIKNEKAIVSITGNKEVGKEIEAKGVKVYYLNDKKFKLFRTISRFRKIVKKEKPDILNTFLIHADIFGRIFGRLFGIKKIACSIRNDYSDLRFLNFIDKYTQFLVDLYVPNSNALVGYLHRKNKVPLRKIRVLPNAIDIKEIYDKIDVKYDIRKELNLPKDSFIILCVARLKKQKRQEILIIAFKDVNYKNCFLIFAGDGDNKDSLEKLTRKLNLENKVFFLGTRNDVPRIINNSNLFVLPSIKEGMSNALLEAMALKKPIIVSSIKQNTELIKHKKHGLVFEVDDCSDLRRNINFAIKNEKEMNKFALSAYDKVKKGYSIERIVEMFENLYEGAKLK